MKITYVGIGAKGNRCGFHYFEVELINLDDYLDDFMLEKTKKYCVYYSIKELT